MRRLTAAALCTVIAAAAASCAPPPPGPDGMRMGARSPRACFVTSQVNNFRAGDDQTLYLRAGRSVYRLESYGFCRDLDWANALLITPEYGGASRLCEGDTARIGYAAGPAGPNGPCRARVVTRMSEAEVAALPGRLRP